LLRIDYHPYDIIKYIKTSRISLIGWPAPKGEIIIRRNYKLFMKNLKKGFTLIELLVVVAIIGILASVVLASLNTARAKGADAAAKANLDNMRAQAAIYYDTNNGYSTGATSVVAALTGTAAACAAATNHVFLDATMAAAISAADKAEGGTGASTPTSGLVCAIDAATSPAKSSLWAIYVPLKNNAAGMTGWCVDSTGASKNDTGIAAGACN
jgi:prepilin-type N-terminal cleavage/methylation domain-containing protein